MRVLYVGTCLHQKSMLSADSVNVNDKPARRIFYALDGIMQQSEVVSCENVNLEECSNEELVAQCSTLSLKAQEANITKAGTVDVGVFLAD